MKVLQHDDGCSVWCRQRVDRTDGGQWIGTGSLRHTLAGDVQSRINIPGGKLPLFVAAELCNLSQSLLVFVGFDPDPGKAGPHVFC